MKTNLKDRLKDRFDDINYRIDAAPIVASIIYNQIAYAFTVKKKHIKRVLDDFEKIKHVTRKNHQESKYKKLLDTIARQEKRMNKLLILEKIS